MRPSSLSDRAPDRPRAYTPLRLPPTTPTSRSSSWEHPKQSQQGSDTKGARGRGVRFKGASATMAATKVARETVRR